MKRTRVSRCASRGYGRSPISCLGDAVHLVLKRKRSVNPQLLPLRFAGNRKTGGER